MTLPSPAAASELAGLALAAAPQLVLGARIVCALLVFPLLYRALARPGEGWTGGEVSTVRRIAFALVGAGIFFLLTAQWAPEPTAQPGAGKGFQAYYLGSLQHRSQHSGVDLDPGGGRGSAVENLRKAADLIPESAYFKRHLGIALADSGDYRGAMKTLEQSMTLLAKRAPGRAAEERAVWRTFFTHPGAPPAAIDAGLRRLESFNLGWLARVSAAAAYKRLKLETPPALRASIGDQARAYFIQLSLGGAIALLIIPQLGLISLGVGIVLIATRVLRPAAVKLNETGFILWESFIVMMAMSVAPILIPGKPSPETQPGAYSALLLARDGVQLLAIGYLWWRLRTHGFKLAEVGLHTRHLGANILVGVMGALVMIPLAYLIGILTQAISDRFFPNIAPPYHPLQGMTATSGNWEVRAALFIAAAIGAPLLEEIFFRGALYGALRRRFGIGAALLASSAFFAILHPQLPLGFLPIAVLGAVFAGLYEWRQSLIPGMVAHAINNAVAFVMLNLVFPLGR